MSGGELALAKVCSNWIHTLSLMATGRDWTAEPPAVLNSLSHTQRTEAFSPSSGYSKAEHRCSSKGTGGQGWETDE